jgi:hypothetical protein
MILDSDVSCGKAQMEGHNILESLIGGVNFDYPV